jgi:hypothetical protein
MARGLLIWMLIMLVETIHGVLRALLLVPRVGPEAAERIGWPVGAVLVIAIATLTIRWTRLSGAGLLRLGAAWAVLTVLFELAIGWLRGLDAQALLAALGPWSGSIAWSAALMLAAPFIAARLRGQA